jgi:hypothetical protein
MPKTLKTVAEQAPDLALSLIKESKSMDWADTLTSGKTTIKEMIGTDDGASEFLEKVTYDAYSGREAVPLVYKQLYNTRVDRNFPLVMTNHEFGPVQVVFLQKYEGGEVKFGTLAPGVEKVVKMVTYAAGIEYNEDIIEYNQTWRVSDIGMAFGEAYNKLLNHLHLYPIVGGTYTTTAGGVKAQYTAQKAGTAQEVAFDTNIATTLMSALQVLPKGTKMLVNEFDLLRIEDALAGAMLADDRPNLVKRRLSMSDLIVYNGDEVEVGGKTYEYPGVDVGEAYLVTPRRNFQEYIKHDLRIDSDDGDLSRLILTQVVGRARRGLLTSIGGEYGAIKVNLEA